MDSEASISFPWAVPIVLDAAGNEVDLMGADGKPIPVMPYPDQTPDPEPEGEDELALADEKVPPGGSRHADSDRHR